MDKYFDSETGLIKSDFVENFISETDATEDQKKSIRLKLTLLMLAKFMEALEKEFNEIVLPDVNTKEDLPKLKEEVDKLTNDPKYIKVLNDFFTFGIKVELDQLKMDSK